MRRLQSCMRGRQTDGLRALAEHILQGHYGINPEEFGHSMWGRFKK